MTHEPQEEYVGGAVLTVDGRDVEVEVHLRGSFQPIDGRFHWQGRVATPLAVAVGGTEVVVTTEFGSALGRLADVDPWGRFRLSGTGRPPF